MSDLSYVLSEEHDDVTVYRHKNYPTFLCEVRPEVRGVSSGFVLRLIVHNVEPGHELFSTFVRKDEDIAYVADDMIMTGITKMEERTQLRANKLGLLCHRLKTDVRFGQRFEDVHDVGVGVGIVIKKDGAEPGLLNWNPYSCEYEFRHKHKRRHIMMVDGKDEIIRTNHDYYMEQTPGAWECIRESDASEILNYLYDYITDQGIVYSRIAYEEARRRHYGGDPLSRPNDVIPSSQKEWLEMRSAQENEYRENARQLILAFESGTWGFNIMDMDSKTPSVGFLCKNPVDSDVTSESEWKIVVHCARPGSKYFIQKFMDYDRGVRHLNDAVNVLYYIQETFNDMEIKIRFMDRLAARKRIFMRKHSSEPGVSWNPQTSQWVMTSLVTGSKIICDWPPRYFFSRKRKFPDDTV